MKPFARLMTLGIAAATAATAASADTFLLNFEAPTKQYTTAGFTTSGVETFDTRSSGGFTTDFGTGGVINGTYTGITVLTADQYGGAGGIGRYAAALPGSAYSLTFTTTLPSGINYFGYWLSALDSNNQLEFRKGGVTVGTLTPADVLAEIATKPNASDYYGNPTAPFAGANSGEPYVFINAYDTTGTFDEVIFSQGPSAIYESDNHTVGFYTTIGGVPEPTTWALMIAGFGLVGAAARRRRTTAVAA